MGVLLGGGHETERMKRRVDGMDGVDVWDARGAAGVCGRWAAGVAAHGSANSA